METSDSILRLDKGDDCWYVFAVSGIRDLFTKHSRSVRFVQFLPCDLRQSGTGVPNSKDGVTCLVPIETRRPPETAIWSIKTMRRCR
ncbi:hypothetical protein JTE90_002650 [Oedothorax gibbosus]|uniref:Uncharacterized protein n=1 Tax=Oedothorax gibbosus TaxID=931172 RepID=A0AAV6U8V4_9ARAC|nr:hypothetical protein JTE90_002650 [Oedothorax gibbosus]